MSVSYVLLLPSNPCCDHVYNKKLKAQYSGTPYQTMPTTSCSNCHKAAEQLATTLKRCGSCHTAPYCSRECQVAHWPTHKPVCQGTSQPTKRQTEEGDAQGKAEPQHEEDDDDDDVGSSGAGGSLGDWSAFRATMTQQFSHLPFIDVGAMVDGMQNNAQQKIVHAQGNIAGRLLIHSRLPHQTVYQHLIDAFRFRCEDQYVFASEHYGIYNQESPNRLFGEYLNMAERRRILPPWCSKAKRKECLKLAYDASKSWYISHAVEKHDIVAMYMDVDMPEKLRSLGNLVYGEVVGTMAG